MINNEAIFIDRTKIEASANKFTFVWKKSIEHYHANLIEKSNAIYYELLQNEIIPEFQRQSDEQLSITELTQMIQAVDEVVKKYAQQIEASTDVPERKQWRSERKYPKQVRFIENEMSLALMAVNLRKFAAINARNYNADIT